MAHRLLRAVKDAVATAKCACAERAKTARPGRWECLECGAVWNIPDDTNQEASDDAV